MKLLVLLLIVQLVLSAPAKPQISDSFTATVRLSVSDSAGYHAGTGVWGVDQPSGRGVENYKFDSGNYDVFNLERYDLGMEYQIASPNTSKCIEYPVNGSMPKVWDWLSIATYAGTEGGLDIWETSVGYADLRLAVRTNATNTPVYFVRNSRDERRSFYNFTTWMPTAPAISYFAVPTVCASVAPPSRPSAACISRADIIARAKVWVDDHVPYNQGATYQGYREDCSGYVSMCWDSEKPGHTTDTMHEIAHAITKAELLEGDCLLYASEHVVLFGGWTDSDHSHYQAYEETKPGEGTVTRPTPYPYWYSTNDFKPYRYNNVC